uniref:GP104 n=1 Tax=Caviid herpesvirus 2 str. CIDMTR TaxID=1415526 RepID=U6H6U0_9BETA|nr:GP104 [Caviid herpesvirus 2 str. CIDMTR]
MRRNHPGGRSSSENVQALNPRTLSTIRSILAADDILRTKVASYLDPRLTDSADILFPTQKTIAFFQLIHGEMGSRSGQTIHQVLRDPSVLRKQIFYGLCNEILNSVTMREVAEEWRSHNRLFPYPFRQEPAVLDYLNAWAGALEQSVESTLCSVLISLIDRYLKNHVYELYVDWIVTIGLVPLSRPSETVEFRRNRDEFIRRSVSEASRNGSPLLETLLEKNRSYLARTITELRSLDVHNSVDLSIRRFRHSGKLAAHLGDKSVELHVAQTPLAYGGIGSDGEAVIYTTPAAHLYRELSRYDAVCRHQKVCQLLNTFPVKAITTSRHELNSKKIVELMEKHDRGADAKKSIMKFLLNIADSKSKIGLEDSVEAFIQEVTPSMVDQTRLLPSRPPFQDPHAPGGAAGVQGAADRNVRELFKKQVIKCLEDQIQDQMDQIQDLKLINQNWERRARELALALARYGHREAQCGQERRQLDDLNSLSVNEAVQQTQSLPFEPLAVDDNRLVANSFFSQYIPDTVPIGRHLDELWELEYTRTFKLRKLVTYQGTEETVQYSNYTIERVLLPLVHRLMGLSSFTPIPEDYVGLSYGELIHVSYRDSKLNRYVRFVCAHEVLKVRSRGTVGDSPQTEGHSGPLVSLGDGSRKHSLTEDVALFGSGPVGPFSDELDPVQRKVRRIRRTRNIQHYAAPQGYAGGAY